MITLKQPRNALRLSLAIATTNLAVSAPGTPTAETDVCWADTADHSKVWPVAFFFCKAFPANPMFFTALSVDSFNGAALELVLVDSTGTEIGKFAWTNPANSDHINCNLYAYANYYDYLTTWPQPNPLLTANGAKLRLVANTASAMTVTLPTPFEVLLFRCAKPAWIDRDGEEPYDLFWISGVEKVFTDPSTPASYDLSGYFLTATVRDMMQGLAKTWYPARRYETWALMLKGPVPDDMVKVYARGTIDAAGTLSVTWADSHFNSTTKVFTNPLPGGYSGRPLRFGLFIF